MMQRLVILVDMDQDDIDEIIPSGTVYVTIATRTGGYFASDTAEIETLKKVEES